jgi:hypothetical protein
VGGFQDIGAAIGHWLAANSNRVADFSQFGQFLVVTLSGAGVIWQIRSQNSNSAREEYFRGLFNFNDRFQRLADMRRDLLDRFDQADKSLSREAVMRYFTQYWLLSLEEWEYFCAGLLALDTYVAWTSSAYAHLAGERDLSYFDGEGRPQVLSSRDISEDLLFRTSFHAYTGFVAFFRGLHDLKAQGGILSQTERVKRIADYVRAYMGRENIRLAHSTHKYRPRKT